MKAPYLILSSLFIATTALAGSASGQGRILQSTVAQGNGNIVLYDQVSYQGNNANFSGSTANVGPQWRRMVRSATINGGSWLVCENPNFNGRCVTLTQSVPDLASYNLRRVGSVRPVRAAGPRDWYIVVYNQVNYRGNPRRYRAAVSNLGTARVRSVTIGRGRWEICTDRNFGGDCVVLDSSVPDLSTEGFAGYVRSLRPAPAQPR
jgi:hypothetical protein